jgi:hypothetical protein
MRDLSSLGFAVQGPGCPRTRDFRSHIHFRHISLPFPNFALKSPETLRRKAPLPFGRGDREEVNEVSLNGLSYPIAMAVPRTGQGD